MKLLTDSPRYQGRLPYELTGAIRSFTECSARNINQGVNEDALDSVIFEVWPDIPPREYELAFQFANDALIDINTPLD